MFIVLNSVSSSPVRFKWLVILLVILLNFKMCYTSEFNAQRQIIVNYMWTSAVEMFYDYNDF